MANPTSSEIPKTQTAAIVRKQGGPVEFDHEYPVSEPGPAEILVKVLYTGVCQSGECPQNVKDLSSRGGLVIQSQTGVKTPKNRQEKLSLTLPFSILTYRFTHQSGNGDGRRRPSHNQNQAAARRRTRRRRAGCRIWARRFPKGGSQTRDAGGHSVRVTNLP